MGTVCYFEKKRLQGEKMLQVFLVGCGGFIGACCRYLLSLGFQRWDFQGFPVATLLANVIGAFFMGFITALFSQCFPDKKGLQLVLTTGTLGGFTTFSTFSLETVNLYQSGHWGQGSIYLLMSIGGCLSGILLGRLAASWLLSRIG